MDIREWLTAQHRTRFIAGEALPPKVLREVRQLVTIHRRGLGLPVAGYGPIQVGDVNAALDWIDEQAAAGIDWPITLPKEAQ